MKSRALVMWLLALSITTWWACERAQEPAVEEEEAAEEAGEPAPVATIAGSTLTTTVSRDEATPDTMAVGTWELDLGADGAFQVRQEGNVAAQGRYTVEGNRITFTDEGGPLMCAEPTGTYQWSIAGDQVTMTPVDDSCPGRLTVLTAHPLTRSGS